MKKEAEILIKYVQADFSQRMYMFLQFPDLRDAFQEIDRNKLRPMEPARLSSKSDGEWRKSSSKGFLFT